MFKVVCLLIITLCFSPVVAAGEAGKIVIQVTGLFKNTAVVNINGQQTLLKKLIPGPYGIVLVKADSKSALIKVNGKVARYYMGRSIGTTYKARELAELVVPMNDQGQYLTAGSINRQSVTFLLDTGANTIAMNENTAQRLGIQYRENGKEGQAMTAGGITRSWSVQLDRVKVGEIELKRVNAAIVEGESPYYVLLGMSFLDQVNFVKEDRMMRIKQKF